MNKVARSVLFLSCVLVAGTAAWADIPQQISHQGYLWQDGEPLNGQMRIEFALFDSPDPSASSELWREVHEEVAVSDGVFTVMLGSTTPLSSVILGGDVLWLEIAANGEVFFPRTQIGTVPYALRASIADSVRIVSTTTSPWAQSENAIFVDGLSVGIGDASPEAPLDVVGQITVQHEGPDAAPSVRITADSNAEGISGGTILLEAGSEKSIRLRGRAHDFEMYDEAGQVALDLRAGSRASLRLGRHDSNSGELKIFSKNYGQPQLELGPSVRGGRAAGYFGGRQTWELSANLSSESQATGGRLLLYNPEGEASLRLVSDYNGTGEGRVYADDIVVGDDLFLSGDFEGSGKTRVITDVLEIRGGADLSERFAISSFEEREVAPGTIMSIDVQSPGAVVVSSEPYDRLVAGIVSGAGGVSTGLVLGQDEGMVRGDVPLALSGRVYVRADAGFGSISPGDFLTTSPTPGHAMRAAEFEMARGAIIGKAMTPLDDGTGLVLVLVNLQ